MTWNAIGIVASIIGALVGIPTFVAWMRSRRRKPGPAPVVLELERLQVALERYRRLGLLITEGEYLSLSSDVFFKTDGGALFHMGRDDKWMKDALQYLHDNFPERSESFVTCVSAAARNHAKLKTRVEFLRQLRTTVEENILQAIQGK